MRRKAGPALSAAALAGCAAGWACLGGRTALAETPMPGFGGVYATPTTGKADSLAPVANAAKKADALPVAGQLAPRRNVETTTGVLLPPSTTLRNNMPLVSRAAGKTAALTGAATANNAGELAARGQRQARRQNPPQSPAGPARQPVANRHAPHVASEEPGEILWSNRTATLSPGASSDAGPPNTTSIARIVELAVPMRDGTFYLGEIGARISPQNAVSLSKERLVQIATPLLRTSTLETLKSIADSDGYLPLSSLNEKDLDIRYDPAKVELQFAPGIDQRATGKLSAGRRGGEVRSENIVKPANFAGYVNMRAGADYSSRPFLDEESSASARIAFDGAMRWSDIVFESAARFDIEDGFARGPSRLIYDMPNSALRISAGDVSPLKSDLQGGPDLLGISIEKSYQKLQPGANIRPTGSRSFRIERPSNVDVMVNGHVMQRLHLRAGDYNLDDLPLTAGANDISLVIEDDVGQKRTLDFTVFSGRSLLAPGISEWALSAGVASRYGTGNLHSPRNFYSELEYDFSTPVITGTYERGLTPDLTGNVHLQATPEAVMGGGGAAFQTAFGFWVVDGAISRSAEAVLGYAGGVGYELANVQGKDGVSRSFRIAADYRSERFAALDTPDAYNRTMLDLSAVYAQPLAWDMSGSISGTYAIGRGHSTDRYGMGISLSRSFGPSISAGLSAGFEQAVGDNHAGEKEDAFSANLRLSYRVDDMSSIDVGQELNGGRSHVAYRHQEGTGIGSWNAQIELDRTGTAEGRDANEAGYGVNGSLGYIANRAELTVSQHSGLAGLDTDRLDQRSSVTAGTALAFADGRLAVGRPVSNGFAIVGAHDTLAGSDVMIGGSRDARQGASGLLGPALVSDMSAYSPARVAYDVDNLPVGYDLGAGAFDLYPAYRSGYRLTVGSDYTVTAFGTLVDEKGEPVALLTGTAMEEDGDRAHKITVFTNRAGRFGAQGLRPGRWLLDMATEPATRYVLDVPKDAVGLVKLETLRPMKVAP